MSNRNRKKKKRPARPGWHARAERDRNPHQELLRKADSARRRAKLLRLYSRSDGLCFYCRTPLRLPETRNRQGILGPDIATRDHLIPRSRGGSNRNGNLVAACNRCNNERGVESWVHFLHRRQHELFGWRTDEPLDLPDDET